MSSKLLSRTVTVLSLKHSSVAGGDTSHAGSPGFDNNTDMPAAEPEGTGSSPGKRKASAVAGSSGAPKASTSATMGYAGNKRKASINNMIQDALAESSALRKSVAEFKELLRNKREEMCLQHELEIKRLELKEAANARDADRKHALELERVRNKGMMVEESRQLKLKFDFDFDFD